MQHKVIGWDIGGAHVKIAISDGKTITRVHQLDCPLWKGVAELTTCIDEVKSIIDINAYAHAVTMTGELVDHFQNREQGVHAIIAEMTKSLSACNVQFYAGYDGFVGSTQAVAEHNKIASANWLASAHYAASKVESAFFIDIGSTTTDIVEVRDGKVKNTGYTDEQRLVARELVYCGVVRTPVFAICNSAQVKDRTIPVINEYFANAADIYRLTGELSSYADLSDSLDGRSKDKINSATRLARMFANDYQSEDLEIWERVAKQIRTYQLQMIKDACRHQFMNKNIPLATPIVGAGIGRFLIKDLAQQLGRKYIDFEELFHPSTYDTSTITPDKNNLDAKNPGTARSDFKIGDCAPAAAVACLALSDSILSSPEEVRLNLKSKLE